jgi:hypothetical protein
MVLNFEASAFITSGAFDPVISRCQGDMVEGIGVTKIEREKENASVHSKSSYYDIDVKAHQTCNYQQM